MPTKYNKQYGHQYGNTMEYRVRRLKRDAPEVCARLAAGEFNSARAAEIAAGLIHVDHPDDVPVNRLLDAWIRADVEARQQFLLLVEAEIEAAERGEYLNEFPPERRQTHLSPAEGAAIPVVEALLEAGKTMGEVARLLGVTRRTVCRWRAGKAKPSQAVLERLAGIPLC